MNGLEEPSYLSLSPMRVMTDWTDLSMVVEDDHDGLVCVLRHLDLTSQYVVFVFFSVFLC